MAKSTEKRRRGPRLIMALGLVLVAAAVVMEAADYPWGRLLGAIPETLPDPAPIVLTGEDADSLVTDEAEPVPEDESGILPGEETETEPPEVYVRLGILKIPSLGVSQHVLEGTGRQMRYGVGHVVGSAGLGQEGNCALSGHRPSPFRYLDKLKEGEKITIGVGETLYTYTVYESFSVLPEETWVLSDIPGETATLTLITCTPYLVSSHRLIVRARLTDTGLNPAAS